MKTVLRLLMLVCFLWAAGLAWFVSAIPHLPSYPLGADAGIVLTGGDNRLYHGFEILKSGYVSRLLITGVGKGVTLDELLKKARFATPLSADMRQRITLGYVARSTMGNADEAQEWLAQASDIHTVRLITANYHMQRSLLEFRHRLPGIDFIADPVFPPHFQREKWWEDALSRHLILSEYHKWMLTWLRQHAEPHLSRWNLSIRKEQP